MMTKIIKVDVVPQSPVFSHLLGVVCCFLCAFWVPFVLSPLMTNSRWSSSPVDPESMAELRGFLCVCCWFNFMTCFSLSGRVKPWAPFFCLLPSCTYPLISTGGSFTAESSSPGPTAGHPKGFCEEAVSGGTQENGSAFLGPLAFSKQPCFELFLGATCSLVLPLTAESCLMLSCMSRQIHEVELLLQVLVCYRLSMCMVAIPCFLSKAKLDIGLCGKMGKNVFVSGKCCSLCLGPSCPGAPTVCSQPTSIHSTPSSFALIFLRNWGFFSFSH